MEYVIRAARPKHVIQEYILRFPFANQKAREKKQTIMIEELAAANEYFS